MKPRFRKLTMGVSALAALSVLVSGCNRKDVAEDDDARLPVEATVELLEHDDDGLSVAADTSVYRVGQSFRLAGTHLRLLEHWPQAEAVPETGDDNSTESHAVEVAWKSGTQSPAEKTEWIYQTNEDGPAGSLPGLDLHVRVLPPGAQPAPADVWETSPKDSVQFGRAGRFFPVPAVGGEAFPGWTVQSIRTFEHALMEEDGGIEESADGGFTNRAVEVTLASAEGTIERHLAFPDHPELTKGIHPALLPVARLAGKGASQSRLAVCDPIAIPGADRDRLFLSPATDDSGKLTAFAWDRENDAVRTIVIDSLPAELEVAGAAVRLLQHRSHARSVVKWRRSETDGESGPVPALVIAWTENDRHERAVLPLDQPTPVRISGRFQTFRYRNAP